MVGSNRKQFLHTRSGFWDDDSLAVFELHGSQKIFPQELRAVSGKDVDLADRQWCFRRKKENSEPQARQALMAESSSHSDEAVTASWSAN